MALPNSYTVKRGAIPHYFEAMLNAQAPDRFSTRFLTDLDFKSTNDRTFISILRELGFINTDGNPTERYFAFLDRSRSAQIVAQGVREAYSDLFAINKTAQELSAKDVENKLRTLYKGAKKDSVIKRITGTFTALCEYADFSAGATQQTDESSEGCNAERFGEGAGLRSATNGFANDDSSGSKASLTLDTLQYHINILLPDTRDQAVYDAIFKSLRDHLGVQG